MEKEDITFRIDVFSPETLPMGRLAEYLAHLSTLYGQKEKVHFKGIEKGSAILKADVEYDAFPKVKARIYSIGSSDTTRDINKAVEHLDEMLKEDNASGELRLGEKIIPFPGKNKVAEEKISLVQWTEIDGVVIKIGGKDSSIPVTIRDIEGNTYNCQIFGEERAKEIAKYYLGSILRIGGDAKLIRHPINGWTIHSLVIKSFEPIESRDLIDVFTDLRNLESNGWKEETEPLALWKSIRGHEW